jgi:hypothetical protein
VETPLFIAALVFAAAAAIAVLVARRLYRRNRELARLVPTPKTPEQDRSEHLDRQLEAVIRDRVTFTRRRVMNRGEYEVFRAAMGVTRQPHPTGQCPFYVFPQVALGQIIGTQSARPWEADQAFRAINSKRCDLLIADRHGNPIAVLEYQGFGHNLSNTATRRNEIKRIALERAGVRFIEIPDRTTRDEMQRTIRDLLARQQSPTPPA